MKAVADDERRRLHDLIQEQQREISERREAHRRAIEALAASSEQDRAQDGQAMTILRKELAIVPDTHRPHLADFHQYEQQAVDNLHEIELTVAGARAALKAASSPGPAI